MSANGAVRFSIVLVLVVAAGVALRCTDPRPAQVNRATLSVECTSDRVEVTLRNVPWYARDYFRESNSFVVTQSSTSGGQVEFVDPAIVLPDPQDGALRWEEPEWEPTPGSSAEALCANVGGTVHEWQECWRGCCQVGSARPTLMPAVDCTEAGGELLPISSCYDTLTVCCKQGGLDAPGRLEVTGADACMLDGGSEPMNSQYWRCVCCEPHGGGDPWFGGLCYGSEDEDWVANVSNCCDAGVGTVREASHCMADAPSPPCTVVDEEGSRCPEVCCGDGHVIRSADECPADDVASSCAVAPVCCNPPEGRAITITGNRAGAVRGAASFRPVSSGTVQIRVRQRAGAVVRFEEEETSSNRCLVTVEASDCAPPAYDISGTFLERYNCDQGGDCVDRDVDLTIVVTPDLSEPGRYTFRSDDGTWTGSGILCGNVFTWDAETVAVTESGVWTFSDAESFTKTSEYEGDGYGGSCTGVARENVRPDTPPAPIGACS